MSWKTTITKGIKELCAEAEKEIETMLLSSFEHANEDVYLRKLREQQVEADREILALEAALEEDGERLLNDEERKKVGSALQQLISLRAGDDADAIKRGIEELEAVCEFYVERRMNSNIASALSGHKVEEFK